MTVHDRVRRVLLTLFAILLALLFLVPLLWMVFSSFKPSSEIFRWPPHLFPETWTLANYIRALKERDFLLYFKNTGISTFFFTVLGVIINTMAGYVFAKYRFPGSTALFMLLLSALMLPLEVLFIPVFQVIKRVGLYNSLWGIIIPPAASPTGVFLVRQYFLSVPDELMEAARIDGASERRIFLMIMLPLAKPIISVLAIFNFRASWNNYLWPLIVIRNPKLYTLTVALRFFAGENTIDWSGLLAVSVVTVIPILIVFLIFQKQFVEGMATTGLKE